MPSTRIPTSITTGPGAPPPGGAQAEDVAASLVAHITDPVGAHAASAISYAGGPNWYNGATNPASDVETQVDKIITDLITDTAYNDSGAARIGSGALQTWADGSQILQGSINWQLFQIPDMLRSSIGVHPWSGVRKIGAETITNTTVTIPSGRLHSQLVALSKAENIQFEGGVAWADGGLNPATNVEAQIDKILSDLAGDTGAAKWGIAAHTVGTVTIPVSDGKSRIEALQNSQYISAGLRPTWLGGRTNPDTDVKAAIAKIITDLNDQTASDDGVERIGAEAYTSASTTFDLTLGSSRSQLNELADACGEIHPRTKYFTPGTGSLIVFNQLGYQRAEVRFDSTVGINESFNWSDALVVPRDGQKYTLYFKQQTSGAGGGTAIMTSWGNWTFNGAADSSIAIGLGAITIYEFEYVLADDLYYCTNKVVY